MGLAERKAVESIKTGDFKTFQSEVNSICGFDLKVNMDWSAFENHNECLYIVEKKKYRDFMFDRVLTALRNICSDEMGKTALKEKLKEIQLVPTTGDLDFSNGVLTVRNDLAGQGTWGADQIQEYLEKHL